jgi:hypothetical protein
VRLGLHELLVRPRDSFDQRLLDCRLNITRTRGDQMDPRRVRQLRNISRF